MSWSVKKGLDPYQILHLCVHAFKGPTYQILALLVKNCQSYPKTSLLVGQVGWAGLHARIFLIFLDFS